MIRVKLCPSAASRRSRWRPSPTWWSAGAAQQGPHHHAPEHPAAPHPAGRRRQGDPRAVGLRLEPRGLREHRPQRDRRPLGRRLRGRASTPPIRRRLRALLRAPPHHPADAAQGQDRVHRDGRGPGDHRHPRRRLHPAHPRRREGLRDARGRRHVDHAARRADALRLRRARRRRVPQGHRGGAAHLRPPGLAAQNRARAHQGVRRQVRIDELAARSTRSSRATGSPSATSTPARCCSSTTRRRTRPACPRPTRAPTATAASSSAGAPRA